MDEQPKDDSIQQNLINLLAYAKELHSIRSKVILDYTQKPVMSSKTGVELSTHENVRLHEDAPGEAWIAIDRIERTSPPAVPDHCELFLQGVPLDNTSQSPSLKAIAVQRVTIEDASDLIEAGIVLEQDVMPIRATDDTHFGQQVDVIIKLEQVPHLQHAFKCWVAEQWASWAEIERARERQIRLYRHYFQIHQELRHHSDEFELVVVQNMVALTAEDGSVVKAPLLEHTVDITVDEHEGYALIITPRETPTCLVTEPYGNAMLPGASRLRTSLTQYLDKYYQQTERIDILFDDALTERLGMAAASVLHPEAYYDPALTDLPAPKSIPVCSPIWMLVLRPKSTQPYIDNIETLTEQIRSTKTEDLPQVGIAFGSPPSHKKLDEDEIDFNLGNLNIGQRPTSSSSTSELTEVEKPHGEMFFPLPYNQEQATILDQTESSNAVSVQGPPGTGKSHTIANIVAHYMSTGRRVLISAKTPEALAGVRSKLPKTLSNLTIAVLDNDSDSKKQVENAISFISAQIQGLNPKETRIEIEQLQSSIQAKRDRIAVIENALLKHAASQLTQIEYKNQRISPAQLVKLIRCQQEDHSWFPDALTLSDEHTPSFSHELVVQARELRQDLGEDVFYSNQPLPDLNVLPDVPALRRIHESLQQSQAIERALLNGETPEPAENTADFEKKMKAAIQVFNDMAITKRHLREHDDWTKLVIHLFSPVTIATERQEIVRLINTAGTWLDKVEPLMVYAINVDLHPWEDNDLAEAIKRAASGQKPFGLGALFKSKAKRAFEQIQIRGQYPQSAEEWQLVHQMLEALKSLQSLKNTWRALAGYIGFPDLPDTVPELVAFLRLNRPILDITELNYEQWTLTLEQLKELYPYGVDHTAVAKMGNEFERLHNGLRQWVNRLELIQSQQVPRRMREAAEAGRGPVFNSLRTIADKLGEEDGTTQLGDTWRVLRDKITLLKSKQAKFEQLSAIADTLRQYGAPNWAQQLCSVPAEGYEDQLTPGDWRDAWELAQARGFIASLPSRDQINALAEEQNSLEQDIQRQFDRLIELRALLGLRKGMTEKIASGLARFAAAFSRIGRNVTAKRSKQHWKEARDAMMDCYDAIPCWIIPEGRVAEQIPAKLKAFDLVIIDEASQSDITAIPVILRGKKLLVVGDDKQVSPSLVGIKEERISQLMEDYLGNHPLKQSFHPTNSLYDLVGIMSPGKRTSLREHFRCVEPIINFCSKHFYSEPLIPLRLPMSHERLDPPLVDIWVKNGRKVLDRNEAEANVIIEEIEKITSDSAMAGRTIGVISLIGYKQAELISKRLFDRLGVEIIERHQIECGDARFFQGQERDIVFLSMVASPGDARAQTGRENQQRFNVAVSRARDRLVLVRSVGLNDLNNPQDLKAALIEHFQRPIEVTEGDKERIIRCESEFERQVFTRLINDHYRVIPQFEAGHYRIDMVIEGANDRRLAVELDGDQYHGPDNFVRDQIRQKRLERVGWTFWRCWASDWYMNSDSCYADLIDRLNNMGIEPLGSEYSQATYVRHETRGEQQTSEELLTELEKAVKPAVTPVNEYGKFVDTPDQPAHREPTAPTLSSYPEPHSSIQLMMTDLDEIPSEQEEIIEVGDRVTITYEDEPEKQITIMISEHHQEPTKGIVRKDEPLPQAILGAMIGDEFDITTDHPRVGTVLMIEKGTWLKNGEKPKPSIVKTG